MQRLIWLSSDYNVNFTDEARYYGAQTPHVGDKDKNYALVHPRPPTVHMRKKPEISASQDWRIAKTDARDYDSIGSYDQLTKPKQFITEVRRTEKRVGFCDSTANLKKFVPAIGAYKEKEKGLDLLHKRCRSQ